MKLSCSGSFAKTEKFLKRARDAKVDSVLAKYGRIGVDLLSKGTPRRTGLTSSKWGYEIEKKRDKYTIYFNNSNINRGVNIALILQLGHATKNGGFVQGIDYINPAMGPLFSELANAAWKEVVG